MDRPHLVKPPASRFRFDRLSPLALTKLARNPSYLAPRAADLHDPETFRPPLAPVLSENERFLLDAVLADLEADAPRLAYADWAERQGQGELAAYIRDSVREFRGEADLDRVARPPTAPSPLPASPDFAPWAARDFLYRRGFVEGMSLSGRAFISAGAGLFQMAPLRDVQLVAVQPLVGELALCPLLAKLRRLDLAGNRIGCGGVRDLVGSAYISELVELGLSGNDISSKGARVLAAASRRMALESLELADNHLGPKDLEELLAAEWKSLTVLDISGNSFGADGGGVLSRSRVAPQLRQLSASRCRFGRGGSIALFSGERFESLRCLNLSFNALGADGASESFTHCPLPELIGLDLGFNDIEDSGVQRLATAASFGSLRRLDLAANRITASGAKVLGEAGELASVEALNLTTNPVGDSGVAALLGGGGLGSLDHLNLANCSITATGVQKLLATGAIARLRALSLAWNRIGDAGALAIASCADIGGLRDLDLTGTGIGLKGVLALVESPHLVGLRQLRIDDGRLPEDVADLLRGRFGTITEWRERHRQSMPLPRAK